MRQYGQWSLWLGITRQGFMTTGKAWQRGREPTTDANCKRASQGIHIMSSMSSGLQLEGPCANLMDIWQGYKLCLQGKCNMSTGFLAVASAAQEQLRASIFLSQRCSIARV